MKIFTWITVMVFSLFFFCSDNEKEKEWKNNSHITQGINSLSKASVQVNYQDENILVFSSSDKELFPVPESCRRELEQKSRSGTANCRVSTVLEFWPTSSTPQPDPHFNDEAYVLESREYVNTDVINEIIRTYIKIYNPTSIYRDTIMSYHADYQAIFTRYIHDESWNGIYFFSHYGCYYESVEDSIQGLFLSWDAHQNQFARSVFRYAPYW